ncbi:hypothetical protein OC846_006270 [Tilletia horrida]|uniref:Uncharacterized protein n=1 Tax=Tilletia horrida TaxID=155126 RepID=A0AAN6GJ67_9BASI|nr:hypothetical protein OC846_006270 [Tilletia horrida]KAK0551442.1 hypothetical protein OC845_002154 [Tilletia horrida]KAK0569801.1 hypothetical protein OC861_000512 [Tilletia horrida]
MSSSASAASWVKPAALSQPTASVLNLAPGFTPAQANAALKVLQTNHNEFHCFFNNNGFHNHTAHHILAALSLGAPPDHYGRLWRHFLVNDLDPSFELNHKPVQGDGSEPITRDNWKQHLSVSKYYWSYLAFFEQELAENGVEATLERFIFSKDALSKPALMLSRLVAGAVHPFIHLGYGLEFGMDGIVAEGLAMAAVTEAAYPKLLPEGWFDKVHRTSEEGSASLKTPATAAQPRSGSSIFTVFARMGADSSLAPGTANKWTDESKFAATNRSSSITIASHLDSWHTTPEDVAFATSAKDEHGWIPKVAELVWINTLMMGATSRPGHANVHDFFMMHSHNATIFLPAYMRALSSSAQSRALVLHALARTTAFIWISCGRPEFFIREKLNVPESEEDADHFYHPDHQFPANRTEREADKVEPASASSLNAAEHGDKKSHRARPSAWYDILSSASIHFDEHLVKAIRTQAYFSSVLGGTPAGSLFLDDAELKNKEDERVFKGQLGELDGSAFLRTAAQMMDSQGWATGVERDMHWVRDPIGHDEAWK